MEMYHSVNLRLEKYLSQLPIIGEGVYIAKSAVVFGAVTLGKQSSVWYNAVLRGDIHEIVVGEGANIQDNAVLHIQDMRAARGEHPTCALNRQSRAKPLRILWAWLSAATNYRRKAGPRRPGRRPPRLGQRRSRTGHRAHPALPPAGFHELSGCPSSRTAASRPTSRWSLWSWTCGGGGGWCR